MLATMDALGLDAGRAVEWSKEANRAIYRSSIFRLLMALLSPDALLAGGQMRVLRGGSWDLFPGIVRVSYRLGGYPASLDNNFGFRCSGEVDIP